MNILIINHYAGSKSYGMEYRPYYMAKELTQRGHKVSIIASSYSHLRRQDLRLSKKENIEGIDYYWEPNIKYTGNGVLRVLNMMVFGLQVLLKAPTFSKLIRPDFIIASSPHPFIIFGAKRIANCSKAKLFFEVRDIWPLTLVELGGISKYNPFVFVMGLTENYSYRCSDKVISLLPCAKAHMVDHGMLEDKFIYLPNGIDEDWWSSRNNKIVGSKKNKEHFSVGYTGYHGSANALEYLVDAMSLLKDKQISLLMVGDGPEKARLQAKAESLGLTNITFLGQVEKSLIPEILKSCDALFIGWKKSPIYRFGVSPNKLVDYMISSRPVVHSIEAGNDIVKESGCGISVEPENAKAIADAILKLKEATQVDRDNMGQKGREYILNNHSYVKLVDKLLNEMNKC